MEEELKRIECLIERCNQCKLNACITCDICWSEVKAIETVLNLVKKQQEEIEHQIEKRNNQKAELAILNEKQKEFNKLINTVKSYKGMFKRQQKEIDRLLKDNRELGNRINELTDELHKIYPPAKAVE